MKENVFNQSDNIKKLLDVFDLGTSSPVVRSVLIYSTICCLLALLLNNSFFHVLASSNRLLESTNGSDALENDLPRKMIRKFKDKNPSLMKDEDWRSDIKWENGEYGVLPFLSFSTNADGIEAERRLDV